MACAVMGVRDVRKVQLAPPSAHKNVCRSRRRKVGRRPLRRITACTADDTCEHGEGWGRGRFKATCKGCLSGYGVDGFGETKH